MGFKEFPKLLNKRNGGERNCSHLRMEEAFV